jgi:hypothetical protein
MDATPTCWHLTYRDSNGYPRHVIFHPPDGIRHGRTVEDTVRVVGWTEGAPNTSLSREQTIGVSFFNLPAARLFWKALCLLWRAEPPAPLLTPAEYSTINNLACSVERSKLGQQFGDLCRKIG